MAHLGFLVAYRDFLPSPKTIAAHTSLELIDAFSNGHFSDSILHFYRIGGITLRNALILADYLSQQKLRDSESNFKKFVRLGIYAQNILTYKMVIGKYGEDRLELGEIINPAFEIYELGASKKMSETEVNEEYTTFCKTYEKLQLDTSNTSDFLALLRSVILSGQVVLNKGVLEEILTWFTIAGQLHFEEVDRGLILKAS